ncbi:Dnaj heat shock n-terminal domain-containing protein [Thalictrum thalictroides]|uniref:Dnaj heat shock n-terminal domain-containing protein n=1 Tax=Thalictrum thalictroides TaxID=46969 RepID=A0A7J6V2B3_THATH|nr:Dnaj heat shock n-terminal domain-containing protein [Thalictrum thalictroides]
MLLVGESSIHKTYYDILSVNEDATYEEIRASYKSVVLNSHPDKLSTITETSDHPHELEERFLNVRKAWEILGDSKTRALYDHELRDSRHDLDTAEDISLEEMTMEEVGEVVELFYQCRCGDYYAIDSTELKEMGYTLDSGENKAVLNRPDSLPTSVILPCGSCSLKIRLMINAHC